MHEVSSDLYYQSWVWKNLSKFICHYKYGIKLLDWLKNTEWKNVDVRNSNFLCHINNNISKLNSSDSEIWIIFWSNVYRLKTMLSTRKIIVLIKLTLRMNCTQKLNQKIINRIKIRLFQKILLKQIILIKLI